jgi:hypothetical protein
MEIISFNSIQEVTFTQILYEGSLRAHLVPGILGAMRRTVSSCSPWGRASRLIMAINPISPDFRII